MTAPVATRTSAKPVLGVESLGKRYGARAALRGVSFAVEPGELLAVIGPNGAGKTTLLSILAGLQAASEGRIEPRAERVGWVPQQAAVYSKLSARENLMLFARLERVPDPPAAVAQALEQIGLADRADEELGRLSGGNRQRVNIAVGMLASPNVLLLDEPSSSLDPRQRARLWDFVVTLARGGTAVIYSTHNVQEAERYADRVLVLADGELLFSGSPAALETEVGEGGGDFESSFVRFLHDRGH
jgi:ABC-2 type transport system ATP-binding protein